MSWTRKPLSELANFCLGKMLDEKKNRGELRPYLANLNVRWGEFDLMDLREMRFEHHELERYGLQCGDIVMCEGGDPGRCSIWKAPIPEMMIQKALHRIRPNTDELDNRFLYYSFLHIGKRGGFKPYFTGSTIKHLTREKLATVEIAFPSLSDQKRIADYLSTYDNLIENNRRRIQLLEESARLLYREWFVYLRFPGHEHVKIVDGVPEGWLSKKLGEILTLNYGKALKADTRISGPYPVYGSSGIVGTHETALVTGPSIIIGRKGNVGSVYWASKNSYPIDTVYFINAEQSNLYLYYALQYVQFINTDVAVPGLNRDMAYSRHVLVPSETILQSFINQAQTIRQQIEKLVEFNNKLTEARDLLLPRLMSGEISV